MQTSGAIRRENAQPRSAVIASAAKQSTFHLRRYGLLRFARNDGDSTGSRGYDLEDGGRGDVD